MINIIHSLTRAYWSVKSTLFCPLYPLIRSVVKFLSLLCALIAWVMRIIRPVVCNYFVGCEKYSVSCTHLSGRSVLKISESAVRIYLVAFTN